MTESEELMVNVAAAINNLSFYQEESSVLRHSQLSIAECKSGNTDGDQCGNEKKLFPAFLIFPPFLSLVFHSLQ